MRHPRPSILFTVLLGIILTLPSPSLAGASPILYSFSGTANGSLGGTPFSNTAFHVRVNADTANIAPLNEPGFTILNVDDESSTIQIDALATATFSDSLSVFDNKTNSILAWGSVDGDFFDLTNAAFGAYNLNTALGPIAIPDTSLEAGFGGVATSQGSLTLVNIHNMTFTATVPEPGGALAFGVAAVPLLVRPGRLRRQSSLVP